MKTAGRQEPLNAQLLTMALRALTRSYETVNLSYFEGQLKRPILELSQTETRLGQWIADKRTMQISCQLLMNRSWGIVVEVLKHEMAHQFVEEVLNCRDETAHGPTFQKVCQKRGIDAKAVGRIADPKVTDEKQDAIIARVSRLLALAASPNQNEAEAAMNAAQKLMLKHNITAIHEHSQENYGFRHLGTPTGKVFEHQRVLALILADHFFVDVIWVPVWRVKEGKNGSVLEVIGTKSNIEIAEYVHAFLTRTADQLWLDHKRKHRIDKNRDRRSFLAGVMTGFYEKLKAQEDQHKKQGLIWIGDPTLAAYFKHRHPYTQKAYYNSRVNSQAHSHGRTAGKQIVLNRGIQKGPSKTHRKLLAPKTHLRASGSRKCWFFWYA